LDKSCEIGIYICSLVSNKHRGMHQRNINGKNIDAEIINLRRNFAALQSKGICNRSYVRESREGYRLWYNCKVET
jgi:hypothetical protein